MRSLAASIRRESPREPMDASLPTPLYHQVYLVLRDKIVSGAYGAEGLLSAQNQCEEQYATVPRPSDSAAAGM